MGGLIDMFILFSLSTALTLFLAPKIYLPSNDKSESLLLLLVYLLLPVLILAKDTFGGVSPGKWFVGLKVYNAEHTSKDPSKGKLLLRNITCFIIPFELVALAFGKNGQRIGDMIAKTIVSFNPGKASQGKRILALVLFLFGANFISMWGFSLVEKYSKPIAVAIDQIEADTEIVDRVGGIVEIKLEDEVSVIEDGKEALNYEFRVIGRSKDCLVFIDLQRASNNKWDVSKKNIIEVGKEM